MNELTKSIKIKIAISIIYFILIFLISGIQVQKSYSGFNSADFIFLIIILNMPLLIYWLSIWIWGDGCVIRIITWLFKYLYTLVFWMRSNISPYQILCWPFIRLQIGFDGKSSIRKRWVKNGAIFGIIIFLIDQTGWRGNSIEQRYGHAYYNLAIYVVIGNILGGAFLGFVAASIRRLFTKET
jgi:hypothetical protein